MRRLGSQLGSFRVKSGQWYFRFRETVLKNGAPHRSNREVRIREASGREVAVFAERARVPADVMKRGTEIVEEANRGRSRTPKTLAEFVAGEFQGRLIGLRPRTREHYLEMLKHVLPRLGHLHLQEIGPGVVQALLDAKAATLSPQTVHHIRKTLNVVLRHARRMQHLTGDLPTRDAILPRMTHKPVKPLVPSEVEALCKAVDPETAALIWTLFYTGMRIAEACGLLWSEVNLGKQPVTSADGQRIDAGCLYVCRQYSRGRWSESPKTKSGRRIVPIADELLAVLSDLKAMPGRKPAKDTPDCVFLSAMGFPLDHHNLARRVIAPAAKAVGIPKANFHVLRHSFATLIDGKVTQDERKAMLGHSSVGVTSLYTHPDVERIRAAISAAIPKKRDAEPDPATLAWIETWDIS